MAHQQLANMRYNMHEHNTIPNKQQQQYNEGFHPMKERDVMRLLPSTWKHFEETNGGAMGGYYPKAESEGFRVRPQPDQFHPLPEKPQNVSDPNYQPLYMLYNTSNGAGNLYYQHNATQQLQREGTVIEVPKPRPMRKRRRPPHSYASLIAQAILTSQYQRMTLREIYEWVQTRYPHLYEANETGWQNTIRHNLSLNKCFCKLPKAQSKGKKGSKGGYWTVDVDQLSSTSFGRQILDSGFLSSIEYWHQEQQQAMAPSSMAQSTSSNHPRQEIDFTTLVPFYLPQKPTSASAQKRFDEADDSKASSVLSSPETDQIGTPTFQALSQFHQRPQGAKIDYDSLLNPSFMRVNNLLN
ncbi:hypothetical protein [Absidia glauca]|uniref:Fork-head domain-containing protein n=1 Tax=Absidia glauca TaxID=4829 RepID=A0A163MET9_ABSGL|nr:hypothetical protein [Absidia glauca]